ncbi:hypothetical protein C0J52_14493 [Blattella germanica]|nr:hypothetical protein C0J52_14493 [Blattella germanica]
MAVSKAIIITAVPKYIGNDLGINLKSGNSILRCNNINGSELVTSKMVIPKVEPTQSVTNDLPKTTRKRRLDHLTLEEKLQRKKLKNRVAAQSSRDRKKARMDDLESENEELERLCQILQQEKTELSSENLTLRQELEGRCVGCRVQAEPAEFGTLPQPQGCMLQRAQDPQIWAMWRILMFCLTYQISWTISMEMSACLTWMKSLLGSYDASTHTLTILVPSEDSVCLEEAVQEVATSAESLSPVPSSPQMYEATDGSFKVETASDCGYESLDSPQSEISSSADLSDLWNESFSQLFPTLV